MDYDNWKLATPPNMEYDEQEEENEITFNTISEADEANKLDEYLAEMRRDLLNVHYVLESLGHGMKNRVKDIIDRCY